MALWFQFPMVMELADDIDSCKFSSFPAVHQVYQQPNISFQE